LTPLCRTIASHKPVRCIGTSGTLESIAALCGSTPASNGHETSAVIERGKFDEVLKELLSSSTKHRAGMRGLDDQRRDQIIAGALLVDELFNRLHLRRIHICSSALREGILLDYLARHIPEMTIRREVPDARRRSVLDLARRCDWHKTHSEHVAKLCTELFDDLRSLHGLGGIERELIEYGAMLHDIGWHIGRKSHHKHSMYLIANGDLKNFSEEEVKIIANIARYHRKGLPKKKHDSYASLSAWGRRVVDVGAALLRLADGLDRSHASAISKLQCRIREDKVKCILSAHSDAELEIWGARRKMQLFNKVFGRKMTFALAKR
ncbi:MAG TPA: HD domain-containing protein, partial [Tepidisphaeraceae bacterium]|nr:HD domain-containing protein [Tepidisphaeraceae bacterium]